MMSRKKANARKFGIGMNANTKLSRGAWRVEYIRANDIQRGDRPIYPGLVEALERVFTGDVTPEVRRVAARDVVASGEGIDPILLEKLKAVGVPLCRIPVVALTDGRVWAFDDAYAVHVWQATTPELEIEVAVIPVEQQA